MNLGKLNEYLVNDSDITLCYENGEAYVKVISHKIINFFVPLFRAERQSKAVENLECDECDFEVSTIENGIKIATDELIVKIYDEFKVDIYDKDENVLCEDYRGEKAPFVRRRADYSLAEAEGHKVNNGEDKFKVYVSKKMEENMHFYGLGEKTGHLDKKGYHYVNWNTDNPAPHGETFDRLYKSIPFLIGMKDETAFGIFFDNHFETHFDMGRDNKNYYYFSAVDGNLDYYFIYGPSVKKVVKRYTYLTGTTPLPQLWTLGYQQCRWSYPTRERVMEIANTFREKDIPCDTIYLDIDYMDGYRVFTFDDKKFPDFQGMIKELDDKGFKVVTIIDPGVKVHKGYKIFDEGLKKGYYATDKNGITYVNEVWPGDAVYPDFMNKDVRKWWAENQKIMIDMGVSGIWNDMNEPASFNGPLPDDVMFDYDGTKIEHKEAHNIYGHFMDKATFEGIKKETKKRPFVVTRACYAGTQKYSTIWTGDNQSTWEHLRMSVPMLMNLGLSGMAFCGTDVGGFGHDCSAELLSRWVQMGTFTPLFRNHASMGTRDQEPWAFDEETEEINRKYIKLRYKFIPYIYDMMRYAEENGAPLIRPLLFNYQEDENTYEINDEFMCGDKILVAPVLTQGSKARMVYLPKGETWIDYWNGEEHEGGKYIIRETPLDLCPIYIKKGSIIPVYKEDINCTKERNLDKITFEVYAGKGKCSHYLDDGESYNYRDGEFNKYKIKGELKEELSIEFEESKKGYSKDYKEIDFVIKGYEGKVTINNKEYIVSKEENIIKIEK